MNDPIDTSEEAPAQRTLSARIQVPAEGEIDLFTIRLDPDMSDEENAEYAQEQLRKQGMYGATVTVTTPPKEAP